MAAPQPPANPLLNPQFLNDPYPLFAMLRQNNPVFRLPFSGGEGAGEWILTRHDDVHRVLREPAFSVAREEADIIKRNLANMPEDFQPESQPRTMLTLDPPEHTRLRGLVNKAFTPRRVEALAPRVEAIVAELLDALADRGEMDLIHDFAEPLPAIVIAELLGVPPEDHRQIKQWSSALLGTLDSGPSPDRIPQVRAARDQFVKYFQGFIAARRREPRDDLISAMIAAQVDRDALSDSELVATCNLILIAGHETTTNLIGNGLHALLESPAELERLRGDPGLDAGAVEELLRFDSPVQVTARVSTEDVEFRGQPIAAGALVTVSLGAANRDPEVFPDPDRLDVGRTDNHHVAFGHGVHFCVGAGLARLEARTAFRALLDRLPGLRLRESGAERRKSFVLRGFSKLAVTW